MEALVDDGLARHIGVSNFSLRQVSAASRQLPRIPRAAPCSLLTLAQGSMCLAAVCRSCSAAGLLQEALAWPFGGMRWLLA
jgi:diketogulonate reductase-like aldo/keto reductase